jgi:hypothetical protein
VNTRKRIASIRHPEAGGPEESPVKRQRVEDLAVLHSLCCGIDVHQKSISACVLTVDGAGKLTSEVRQFFTVLALDDGVMFYGLNLTGYLRVMFAVDNIDETLDRLRKRGAQLVGEVVQYQDSYRLCYIRGPEGLLIGLAQELN